MWRLRNPLSLTRCRRRRGGARTFRGIYAEASPLMVLWREVRSVCLHVAIRVPCMLCVAFSRCCTWCPALEKQVSVTRARRRQLDRQRRPTALARTSAGDVTVSNRWRVASGTCGTCEHARMIIGTGAFSGGGWQPSQMTPPPLRKPRRVHNG